MENKHIGQKIREFRTRAGKSQLQLEVEIGAAPGSLSRIESGKTNPTKETIFRIANSLSLSHQHISFLLGINIPENNAVEGGIIFEKGLLLDLLKDELTEKLLARFIPKLLDQLESRLEYLGASLSLVDLKNKTIQLKYFTNTRLSHYTKNSILTRNAYKKLSLLQDSTETKKAALTGELIVGSNLADFTSPPLSRIQANIIQKSYGMKTIMALPVVDKSEVIAVINIGTNIQYSKISDTEIKWIKEFAIEIGPIIRKLLIS